jgi:hypothetical protein
MKKLHSQPIVISSSARNRSYTSFRPRNTGQEERFPLAVEMTTRVLEFVTRLFRILLVRLALWARFQRFFHLWILCSLWLNFPVTYEQLRALRVLRGELSALLRRAQLLEKSRFL